MVCDKCEQKLAKLGQNDPKRDKPGMVKESFNKNKFNPLGQNKCVKCKKQQVQKNDKYCHECAYKNGLCKMCGVKVVETKFQRQSNV